MAIDADETSNGNTLVVDEGTYFEHVYVKKSLNIIGKNRDTTILDSMGAFRGFIVNVEKVNITGFTVQNAVWAVHLNYSSANNIYGNKIETSLTGIYFDEAKNNNAFDNIIQDIIGEGIYLRKAENNVIQGNLVERADCGVSLTSSTQNVIKENTIINCSYATSLGLSSNNSFYQNNLLYDSYSSQNLYSTNSWDLGYPFGGNYWSDYKDPDFLNGPYQNETGSDGIGDKPYAIDSNNQDPYPLMGPINIFNVGPWNATSYSMQIVSNSTISNFRFNVTEGPFLKFDVTGENGTGFCRASIPRNVLWASDEWKVMVDNEPTNHTVMADDNFSYLYFTYQHGLNSIEIQGTNVISEFPSSVIVLLVLIFTTMAFALSQAISKASLHQSHAEPNHYR
jgi:parallel beta-helix repeat protein